jgi:hypothetical protein
MGAGARSERSDRRQIVGNRGDGAAQGDLANWQRLEEKDDG